MDFQALPTDKGSILALTWNDLEPYYRELESRPLNEENIQAWLSDWSHLAGVADEQFWRFDIATTVNTADPVVEERYETYVEEMQHLVKTAQQKLKDRLFVSGLSPKGFETGLLRLQIGENVPEAVKAAILLIAADLYEVREAQIVGNTALIENRAVKSLLHPYRVYQ